MRLKIHVRQMSERKGESEEKRMTERERENMCEGPLLLLNFETAVLR